MITLDAANELSFNKILSCLPGFRIKAERWHSAMLNETKGLMIYEGLRTYERQKQLYESGVRPCAEPGKSYHNFGAAFDWVGLKPVAKATGMWEADWDNDGIYEIGNQLAVKFGLKSISKETGHLQDTDFPTYNEARICYEQTIWPR